MKKFWNFIKNESGTRELRMDGVISEETWWGDEVTPKAFRDELMEEQGDVVLRINSPGGDVFAAAQIYNMLKEYAGKVTVKVDGLAASAASVITMAGDEVQVSPVSMMMIHNPATIAWGDSEEMLRAKEMLDEVKDSIINAYEARTGLSRTKLAHMMDDETWISAHKAVELGFADKIMFEEGNDPQDDRPGFAFGRMSATNSLSDRFRAAKPAQKQEPQKNTNQGTSITAALGRLKLI